MSGAEYWFKQGKTASSLPFPIWEHCFREWLNHKGYLGEELATQVDRCNDADQIRLLASFCKFPIHDVNYLSFMRGLQLDEK